MEYTHLLTMPNGFKYHVADTKNGMAWYFLGNGEKGISSYDSIARYAKRYKVEPLEPEFEGN